MINQVTDFLKSCGMNINPNKSMTVAIRAAPHLKKTAVDTQITFTSGRQKLPNLNREDHWKYLEISFSPEGRDKYKPIEVIEPLLKTLEKAPLKPQQRLYALRTAVIPRLCYRLALGAVTIGTLNKADNIIRSATRKWLALPHDTPKAYFHATVKDGGLGIPSIRWLAPLQRRGRIIAALRTHESRNMNEFARKEIAICDRRLTESGTTYTNNDMITNRWAQLLYKAVDGAGLKTSNKVQQQHNWIADGTRMLSGKDFILCNKVRIGALPTKSRCGRGRTTERRCRAGCAAQETLNHILQQCHRTHAARINRHNAVVAYIARKMPRCGYEVFQEPVLETCNGKRKPDLIGVIGRTALVIDGQVVSEQTDLNQAHMRKVNYYNEPTVTQAIMDKYNVQNIKITSITLSWKGVWSPRSAAELRKLGLITTKDLKVLSCRVLIGDLAAYRIFNATTTVQYRRGVG
ncbi:hypothetical protein PUN28_020514 [Cardiocondyla obscurior]